MSQLRQPRPGQPFPIPQVTEADLYSFHDAHFGSASLVAFMTEFLDPDNAQPHPYTNHYEGDDGAYFEADEDEDGLGYYRDGVKRTLTDEQIAMFRHSEIQALQRKQEKASTWRKTPSPSPMYGRLEDYAKSEQKKLVAEVSEAGVAATKKSKKKKKKKRGSGNGKRQYSPDPERRKRTWDVVETGLDGLDYGETGQSQAKTSPGRQRRRITYDDG